MQLSTDAFFVDKVPGFFPYEGTVRYVFGERAGGILQPGMYTESREHGKVRVICASESHAIIEHAAEFKGTPESPVHLKKGNVLWLSKGYYRETSLRFCRRHPNVPDCPESRPVTSRALGIHEEYELLAFLMQKFLQEPLVQDGEFHQERSIAKRLSSDIAQGTRCLEQGTPIPADCSLSYLSKTVYALLNTFREGKMSAKELPSPSD